MVGNSYGGGGRKFRLPDLQGRAAVGIGSPSGLTRPKLAEKFGSEAHKLAGDELPTHTHGSHHHTWLFGGAGANLLVGGGYNSAYRPANSPTAYPGLSPPATRPDTTSGYITSDDGATGVDTRSTGKGKGFSVVPPSLGVNYIIRYQ